jgi:class 3 adenylate cyclase
MQDGNETAIARRTIVELDLVGYSDIARYLDEHLGANAVMQLNRQIQGFVNDALQSVATSHRDAVNSRAGDNAIVMFEQVADAHRFAEAFHRITEQYNTGKNEASAKRHFRLGISTGDIAIEGDEIAGTTIIDSCRLEAGGDKGHILISADTYRELPAEFQSSYIGPEILRDKRGRQHQVYRYVVVEEEAGPQSRFVPLSIQKQNAYKVLCRHVARDRKRYALATGTALVVVLLAGVYFLTQPVRTRSAVASSASAFLNGIKNRDFNNSYARLSRASQQAYPLSDFIKDHSGNGPKIQDFTVVQVLPDSRDDGRAFARISSSSKLYGQRKLKLEMTKEEGIWRVAFKRSMATTPPPARLNNFINSIFR